jgi:hypothetical protein
MESHDPGQTPHVYEFGDFRLDTENTTSHRLLLNGQPYKIQNKQFCLLSILVKNQGRELSSEELIRQVWSDHVVDNSNRAEYVYNLHHQMPPRPIRTRKNGSPVNLVLGNGDKHLRQHSLQDFPVSLTETRKAAIKKHLRASSTKFEDDPQILKRYRTCIAPV